MYCEHGVSYFHDCVTCIKEHQQIGRRSQEMEEKREQRWKKAKKEHKEELSSLKAEGKKLRRRLHKIEKTLFTKFGVEL
jgi:hypothetical protein